MKIMKLTTNLLSPVKATVIKNNKSNSKDLFYNVKHGGRGENLFTYTIGVDKRLFKPNGTEDELVLSDNNYILLPIYSKNKHKKDSNGNYLYFISTDHVEDHKNDFIILWEIPNKFYTDVKYIYSGDVNLIGSGIIGRSRGFINFTSPAPVLEVYGPCVLTWTAISDNKFYTQTVSFKDNEWRIGKIDIGIADSIADTSETIDDTSEEHY